MAELRAQIATLQDMVKEREQRHNSAPTAASPLSTRISRQGLRSNTAEEIPQPSINQYHSSKIKNLGTNQLKSTDQPDKTKKVHKKPSNNQSSASAVPRHPSL
jgi:Zn-finger domain-containing protein